MRSNLFGEAPISGDQYLAETRAKAERLLASDEISDDIKAVLQVLLNHFRPGPLPIAPSVAFERKIVSQLYRNWLDQKVAKGGDYKNLLTEASQMVAKTLGVSIGTAKAIRRIASE